MRLKPGKPEEKRGLGIRISWWRFQRHDGLKKANPGGESWLNSQARVGERVGS